MGWTDAKGVVFFRRVVAVADDMTAGSRQPVRWVCFQESGPVVIRDGAHPVESSVSTLRVR